MMDVAGGEPEYTMAMDEAMRAGLAQLHNDLRLRVDTSAHLRQVRVQADPLRIALEIGHGACLH
ncbi:hypothetical protein ACFQ93_30175 [Streptomyces sp. NPDC056601]|uniref:hypothetical protein n=1 Tax=Streptomyces sp. NPDC056601 TaxID=3345875 RepID=UPI003698E2BD